MKKQPRYFPRRPDVRLKDSRGCFVIREGRGWAFSECLETADPPFHLCAGFQRDVRAFTHPKFVEGAGADDPSIALTVFDLLSLFGLAFLNAEAAACLQGTVWRPVSGPCSHAIGPERTGGVFASFDDLQITSLDFPIDAEDAMLPDSF